ncbi:MAG: alpha/beta hydrolase [Halolamina sp.]|uniref:alpha/beta fold hydrolase n=1 Tax=Halolamina sp. TaxID=1940283 RepID=UPI002FC390B0
MKLRRALSYAGLGIGVTAVANAVLREESDELPPALDGMQRTYRWRGMNVAYTEAGDTSDPDLVLLHGINAAGSSGEWRAVFDRLSEEYHVIAPDLPGFGRSDRPAVRYSAAFYEEFVGDFLAEFSEAGGDHQTGEAPTVIASSLSAAYAVHAAQSVAVNRFYLVCPTTTAGPGGQKEWVRELLRLPLAGEALFNLIVSKPAIEYFNADHGYANPSGADEEWEEYEWETAHQQNARFAPASFVAGYLDSTIDLGPTLAEFDVPTTLIWGRETALTPVSDGRALAKAAGAELLVFDRAKLLPHVERADAFLDYVLEGELPGDFSAVKEYDPEAETGEDETAESTGADDRSEEEGETGEPQAETEDADDA